MPVKFVDYSTSNVNPNALRPIAVSGAFLNLEPASDLVKAFEGINCYSDLDSYMFKYIK